MCDKHSALGELHPVAKPFPSRRAALVLSGVVINQEQAQVAELAGELLLKVVGGLRCGGVGEEVGEALGEILAVLSEQSGEVGPVGAERGGEEELEQGRLEHDGVLPGIPGCP